MKRVSFALLVGGWTTAVCASPCLDYARQEFKKYLPKADFALDLETDAALGPDAFRVCEEGGRLVITGGNERGCLYGLYSFLEKEGGAGFYASWCERGPKPDTKLRKGLDYSEKPAIPLRECHYADFFNSAFAAKLRLNANAFGRVKGDLARIGGMEGRFDDRLYNCHTFAQICPRQVYFKDHPEYFSEIGGKRVPNKQLCLTNPDVLRLATDFVLDRIAKNPTCRYFGVSQNDGRDGACECAACKAVDDEEGSHAGTMVRFVNAIAAEVEKRHPDKIIETLAYTYSRHPPKKVRLRKNVMVCFCSIECDFSKPIPESRYEENRRFCEDLRAWSAMTDKLYVWDYTTNYGDYLHQFPNVNALQGNVRFFIESGCVSLFEQGNCQALHSDFGELKLWLLAKWMWNPDLDRETLLREFFDGYYGPAAADMRAYLDLCHALPRDEAKNPLTIYLPPTDPVFTDAFYAQAEPIVRRALAKAEGTPFADNVRPAWASVCYSQMIRLLRRSAGRFFVVSRNPEVYDAALKLNAWAKVVDAAVKNDNVRLSEFHQDARMKELARALEAKPAGRPLDEARYARKEGEKVPFVFTPQNVGVPVTCIACDPGVRYQMFVKARVKGADPKLACLEFNLYDARIKKPVDCRVRVMGSDMPDGTREYVGWSQPLEDGMVAGAHIPNVKNAAEFELLEVGFRRAE